MKKKIALALGGGAARGCAHLGVIRALEEQDYEIEAVSGTSIGALVGGVYASGGLQELRDLLPKITKKKVFSYWDFNFLTGGGIVKGKRAEELIDRFLKIKTFKKLNIPFYAVAANIKNGKKVIINSGEVLSAIRASISLPVIFPAVQKGNQLLADGGLVDPVPIQILKEKGYKNIIGVDLNYDLQDLTAELNPIIKKSLKWIKGNEPLAIDVLYRSVMIIQRELTLKAEQLDPPKLIIRPKVGKYKAFDFHRAVEMENEGYRATKKALKANR